MARKKPITDDPKFKLFVFARSYWKAAAGITEKFEDHGIRYPYSMPIAVVEAFALELFLKCLIQVRGKAIPKRTHSAKDLHALLSPADQRQIRKRAYKTKKEIDSILQRSEGVFTKLRYMHEGHDWEQDTEGKTGNFGVSELLLALLGIIRDRHRKWDVPAMQQLGMDVHDADNPRLS